MTVQPLSPQPRDPVTGKVIVGTAAAVLAVAAAHQATQAALRVVTMKAILDVWYRVIFKDLSRSFAGGPQQRMFGYLSAAQETIAAEAASYVKRALAVQNIEVDLPQVRSINFAGLSSDGRDLEGLLVGAVIKAKEATQRGKSEAEAMAAGANYLNLVVSTQISDAGRAADQVALVVAGDDPATASGKIANADGKHVRYGWVRMLTPPSCARCVILAGRFYRWNDGFLRHPNCDCRHIPVEEDIAGDLTTNPFFYFSSLSKKDQDEYFGVANARAIRDGADVSQVVNATTRKNALYTADDGRRYTREGTTRRGFAGRRQRGVARVKRPTPMQIYRDAHGDQQAAIKLLKQFGYIVN